MLQARTFNCPICGYSKLQKNPYQNMPPVTQLPLVQPPYSKHWGMGSYECCSCCGFEFGADDEGMHPENNMSFAAHLQYWYEEEKGAWFWPEDKPANWSLREQMRAAGLVIPGFIAE